MSDLWRETLAAGRVLLTDGATGTELRRRGVRLDANAWSAPAALTAPEVLVQIHEEYLEAGAQVLTANTFGAARFVLAAARLDDRFEQIVTASVDAARRARDAAGADASIAGSVSCLPPGFDTAAYPEPGAERDAYLELATALAECGVDLLVLEMMEETQHARLALEAVQRVGLPYWLGVSCRLSADGLLCAYDFPDVRIEEVLDALLPALNAREPDVVNVMHTPAAAVPKALAAVRSRWSGHLGAYPEVPEQLGPEALAALLPEWRGAGARAVGGCCGTTPAHIRAMRAALEARP